MSKKLTLGVSPITKTVYVGSVLKCGRLWAANKTDVTQEFIAAIKEYVGLNNEMEITSGGKPQFVICVTEPDYVPRKERELTQQRDELLAVLEALFAADLEKCLMWDGKHDQIDAITNAHAAIAKAKS